MGRGIKILESAFPNWKLKKDSIDVWASLLSDLTQEQFVLGVSKFCRDHEEIYPGTNIVAHIRNYGLGKRKRDIKSEAMLLYHRILNGDESPYYLSDIARKAMEMTNKASTGLVADKRWDEKRFIDIYSGFVDEASEEVFDILGKVRNLHIEGEAR